MTNATVKTDSTEENTSSASHAHPHEPDIADDAVDRLANALEAMAVHEIDLMLPGGEMKKGIDPLEGAKLWIEKYYPNLDSQSEIFKLDYVLPIPMLNEKACGNLISIKEFQNKDDGDAKYLWNIKTNMRGQTTELEVTKMLQRSFEITKPVVIIPQYQFKRFSHFFCPESGMDQEIDDVIILGEYRKVIMLEIKSSDSFRGSMTKSLDRKYEI